MPTYDDLVELAEICLRQARAAKSRAVAAELRRMAKEYQKRAAELNSGDWPVTARDETELRMPSSRGTSEGT
jgi:hypothetical protein